MKLDTHVHTAYSGYSSIPPLRHFLRESYNSVDAVYRRAKARGMDLVAITDHDTIEGALTIADRPDVIVSEGRVAGGAGGEQIASTRPARRRPTSVTSR